MCKYCQETPDKTPTSGFIIISQLFLSIANALHGCFALTLSIKNFCVYPISLLRDLCNVDYLCSADGSFDNEMRICATQIYEVRVKMKSGAQKRKEKAQQRFQSSAAKSREPTEFLAASITPTNNNLAEKACNALLEIIQLQRQNFLPLLQIL